MPFNGIVDIQYDRTTGSPIVHRVDPTFNEVFCARDRAHSYWAHGAIGW